MAHGAGVRGGRAGGPEAAGGAPVAGDTRMTLVRTALRRVWPQPLVGALCGVLGLLALLVAWRATPGGLLGGGGPGGVAALCMVVAVVAAYQFPLSVRPKVKVYLASVPFYLLVALAPPALAVAAGGAAALLGELSVRRARGNTVGDVASEGGRRALVLLGGALVAHRGGATPDVPALVLAALVLWVGDILTAPLVLAPLSGEAPGRIVGAVARETWLAEGAQYLLGLLGALAAARAPWAPALLVAPLVVGYGALAAAQAARAEAERAARESRHRSTHDALTGLPNRALLQDRLEQALRALARDGTRLALLLLDLDRFKWVNDTLGHATGDALLREVAARLGGAVRASDTVARLGGDEFAVLLPEADAEGAARVARALHRALDAPVVVDGQALRAEISVGGALAPLHGADPDALLRRADAAMYVAKRGRLGYVLYDPAQKRGDGARLRRAAALRAAIARGALELHYQPQVRARPGPAGLPGWRAEAEARAEALVRWPDGDGQGRLVSPGAFIPLAEETGLIVPLTRWVLGEATRQCRAWEGAGLRCAVAVNLSAWDLQDARCLDTVAGALAGAGLGPERLVLEVTESALLADIARGRETLARLRGMGVRVALDDFGTGYASLARLRELPVDELKVDQGFVRRVAADAADAAVVGAIVALGHALGLEVVAEGVEDQATWERLAALGCDTVQGYHVSRPLPADELARWLHAQPGAPYH